MCMGYRSTAMHYWNQYDDADSLELNILVYALGFALL